MVVCEDDEQLASLIRTLLDGDGRFRVVAHASDGDDAVRLAAEHRPDIVLMDIAMPVLDGFAATAQIREQVPTARVIMLSGSDATQDISRAREAGAAAYVTKDQIAGDLLQAILDTAAV